MQMIQNGDFQVCVYHFLRRKDYSSEIISLKANKFDGSNVTIIKRTNTQPFDIQVYHPKRQMSSSNPCAENNGNCSHLCLISYNNTVGCVCPHLMELASDGKTCKRKDIILLLPVALLHNTLCIYVMKNYLVYLLYPTQWEFHETFFQVVDKNFLCICAYSQEVLIRFFCYEA